jgi:hypothetical protein
MNPISHWETNLQQEKSLSDIYRASRIIERPTSNRAVERVSVAICIIIIFVEAIYPSDNDHLLGTISKISEILVSYTTSILGFLVSGFAIFSTITSKKLLVILAQTPYRDTKLSQFKYMFFNFMNAFTNYLAILAISAFIQIASPIGWIPPIKAAVDPIHFRVDLLNVLIVCFFVLLGIRAFLELKSFIINLYQSVVAAIVLDHALTGPDEER